MLLRLHLQTCRQVCLPSFPKKGSHVTSCSSMQPVQATSESTLPVDASDWLQLTLPTVAALAFPLVGSIATLAANKTEAGHPCKNGQSQHAVNSQRPDVACKRHSMAAPTRRPWRQGELSRRIKPGLGVSTWGSSGKSDTLLQAYARGECASLGGA